MFVSQTYAIGDKLVQPIPLLNRMFRGLLKSLIKPFCTTAYKITVLCRSYLVGLLKPISSDVNMVHRFRKVGTYSMYYNSSMSMYYQFPVYSLRFKI
jgi:hypothetical protein